jgi:hypoxanthine-guanine phosphoribosyltransferase
VDLYLLPELEVQSLDAELFPLLPQGPAAAFLISGLAYPRFLRISGRSAPIFSGGIVATHELEYIAQGVSRKIWERHRGKSLLIIVVLEGAEPFGQMVARDLRQRLEVEEALRVQFASLKVSSYKSGSRAGRHEVVLPLTDQAGGRIEDLRGYDTVIILDDLIDSGATMHWLVGHYLASFGLGPREAYFMLEKKVRRPTRSRGEIAEITPLIGKLVPDEWVVGFGLDLALADLATKQGGLHLFRGTLPGGIYAFNKEIEKELLKACREEPQSIREQLGVYLSGK